MKVKKLFYICFEKFLSFLCDKIVCISEAEEKSALEKKITTEDKLVLIPNGIDISVVRQAGGKSKKELGIPEDAYVVGMIGRISAQKAPDIFIKAAALIMAKIPNAFFIIVGDGEDATFVRTYASQHRIPLLITGWTDEPYTYLKVFDVAVLLSRWEGFGLAVVEYMAAEKNVVATRADAIPTLIDDGTDGFLVPVDCPEEVSDKVLFYYQHPEEARAMKERAFNKVVSKYDISRVVQQHIMLFEKLTSL